MRCHPWAREIAAWMVTCCSLLLSLLIVQLVVPAWRVQISPASVATILDRLHMAN